MALTEGRWRTDRGATEGLSRGLALACLALVAWCVAGPSAFVPASTQSTWRRGVTGNLQQVRPTSDSPAIAGRSSLKAVEFAEDSRSFEQDALEEGEEGEEDDTIEREEFTPFVRTKSLLKFLITSDQMRILIQNGGKNKFARATKTNIFMSDSGDYYPFFPLPRKAMVIHGDKDDVLSVFEQLRTDREDEEDIARCFLVPASAKDHIFGPDGELLVKVRDETLADVITKTIPGSEMQLRVKGSMESVMATAAWLIDQLEEHRQEVLLQVNYQGGKSRGLNIPTSVFLMLPAGASSVLVGTRGYNVKRLSRDFKVQFEIDKSSRAPNGQSMVKIVGRAGDVHAAHLYILNNYIQKDFQASR